EGGNEIDVPDGRAGLARRRRGRPAAMSRDQVLDRIRQLANARGGLFKVHRTHGSLYARARRIFGSWSAAVSAAGVDYHETLATARRRSLLTRRRVRGRSAR